jgi:hypothetical protein
MMHGLANPKHFGLSEKTPRKAAHGSRFSGTEIVTFQRLHNQLLISLNVNVTKHLSHRTFKPTINICLLYGPTTFVF